MGTVAEIEDRLWSRIHRLDKAAKRDITVFSGPEGDGLEVAHVSFASMGRKELWVVKVWSPTLDQSEVISDALMVGLGFEETATVSFADQGYKAGVCILRDPEGPRFPNKEARGEWKQRCAKESIRLKWVCR